MRTGAAIVLAIGFAGCTGDTYVRACNNAGDTMTSLNWESYSTSDLPADSCTEYELPEHGVYANTAARFTIAGVEYDVMPIDHVGETTLGDGHWTFHLTISDYAMHRAAIFLEKD